MSERFLQAPRHERNRGDPGLLHSSQEAGVRVPRVRVDCLYDLDEIENNHEAFVDGSAARAASFLT